MVNIAANAALAFERGFNLTGRLRHAQVEQLADAWFPEIRFHENERFHPIDLGTLVTAPHDVFATLPESAKDSFRIEISGPIGRNGEHDDDGTGPEQPAAPVDRLVDRACVRLIVDPRHERVRRD